MVRATQADDTTDAQTMDDKLAALDPSDRSVLISDPDGPGATDKLAEIDGEYVRYTTWTKPAGEKGVSIKDRGENITIEPVAVNTSTMTEELTVKADERIGECIDNDDLEAAMSWAVVQRHAADLADELLTHWQGAAEEVAGIDVMDGHAGLDGRVAWTAHGDEALYRETQTTVETIADGKNAYGYTISDDVQQIIKDNLRRVLRKAIREAETPGMSHVDYLATIELHD